MLRYILKIWNSTMILDTFLKGKYRRMKNVTEIVWNVINKETIARPITLNNNDNMRSLQCLYLQPF